MFLESQVFIWIILPLLIFVARIVDVTLGTFRIIFITRGMKYLSAVVGFFEVLIWLIAIGQIFNNLTNVACYIAYAGGFASGSFLGVYIAEKIAIGKIVIRIITAINADQLIAQFKSENIGVTTISAQGTEGPVNIIFSIIRLQNLEHVVKMVKKYNPNAFYSIQDVRFAREGIFPEDSSVLNRYYFEMFRPHKKAK